MANRNCFGCGTSIERGWRFCRNCGAPVATAAAPQAKSSSATRWIVGVAIVFVLLIPLAGIVAAIAIPNFVSSLQSAKLKRSVATIRSLGTAVEEYATIAGSYPDTTDPEELLDLVDPEMRMHEPVTDGWKNTVRYQCLELRDGLCVSYAIQSSGKDGAFEILYEDSWAVERANENFDCDLLFVDGRFIWQHK